MVGWLWKPGGRIRERKLTDFTKHEDLARKKRRAGAVSIVASAAITLAKGLAGLATGSLALISDALHSLLDVGATVMTYFVVRAADKPPDERHPFGHAKIESLAAMVETVFLFLLSGAVAYEGLRRLWSGQTDVQPSTLAIVVLIAAILVDAWRWATLRRVAAETGSEALAADALHFASDLVNSVLILVAFAFIAAGYPQADAFVAIGVALFIALAGFRLMRRTIDTLTDAAPVNLAAVLEKRIAEVSGVVAVEGVKLRRVGQGVQGEVGIRVSRLQAFEAVAEIKSRVAAAIAEEVPHAHVTVIANPIQLDDESLREKLAAIALKHHLPIHHITVQHVSGRISLGCDVELPGHMALGRAHEIVSHFENMVRSELGAEIEVETHIEPLDLHEAAGADAEPEVRKVITGVLKACAQETRLIADIHSVRVRVSGGGYVVNYHCRVDPACDVATVHAQVDRIEQVLKAQVPAIRRVVGHAEPNMRH